VAGTIAPNGELKKNAPKVLGQHVVKPHVSQTVQELMEYSVENHRFARKFDNVNYSVGGKTGTAEIADLENGGYFTNDFNGTYAGFVGGDDPQYVIVVAVITPKIGGYAGSTGAQPLFGDIAHMLLDNYNVSRRSN
jgi:cell division protein FtsI/penicillin-binding protein 2